MIQEIDWKVRSPLIADPPRRDPVTLGILRFSGGELQPAAAADGWRGSGERTDEDAAEEDGGECWRTTAPDIPRRA